jgi:uncharacterized protein YqeY
LFVAQSELYLKIQSDMLTATKNKDLGRLKILRFLKSQLDAAAKEKLADLTDEEVQKVLQRKIKQSQEAAAKFLAGSRPDLAAAENEEIELVSGYLPKQFSEEELAAVVAKVVDDLGNVTAKDFGRVMGLVMKQVGARASGSAVKTAVERALGIKI